MYDFRVWHISQEIIVVWEYRCYTDWLFLLNNWFIVEWWISEPDIVMPHAKTHLYSSEKKQTAGGT